jgi:hypothetical protein
LSVTHDLIKRSHAVAVAAVFGAAVLLTACGSASPVARTRSAARGGTGTAAQTGSTPARTTVASATPAPEPAVAELGAAERPAPAAFPVPAGRSLLKLGRMASRTATLTAADGPFTPGNERFTFGLTDTAQRYVYAPTAVYIASSLTAPAEGPYLAPEDPIGVAPQFRSKQNAGPDDLQAVYSTTIPFPRAGFFDVLTLTRAGPKLIGSTGKIAVAVRLPIPNVGQRPPDITTLTAASVHGDIGLLTTRIPPENMHSVSFSQVLGKRPIALLIATPELCVSRVCGPVTDILVELQHQFGARIVFIHQEVYVDNDPSKGLRPQLTAFHLQTEPWLFTINRHGVIAARLQGAFGINEARQAIEAALKS